MNAIPIGTSALSSSRLAYGCFRISGTWDPGAVTPKGEVAGREAVKTAYECGYTLFDLADIYTGGVAERLFGEVLKSIPGMRKQILIATKCGIRRPGEPTPDAPVRYDFSASHILRSCDESLQRMGIDSIDLYQLHRPDYLMDPHEVAGAFSKLKEQGKVRFFGVSNFRPSQITALQTHCPLPLIANQVEISLARIDCLEDGTLDQCLADRMTPMAWSPLAGGLLGRGAQRLLPAQQAYQPAPIVAVLDQIAKIRNVDRSLIALAWLLKHPAGIIPILGSIRPEIIREAPKATEIDLTREEWYRLLEAARGERLP